jgi:D-glycero-D-manno-heptose 1,7-bisphosphate phosphatase
MPNRAIFLDRDGVLNDLIYYPDFGEDESPRTAADLRLIGGALAAVAELQAQGWQLFLVSNQPSYAKGKTTLADLKAVHAALEDSLKLYQITLTAAYYAYTHPKGIVPEYTGESVYRKPNAGFLLEAARDYDLDLASCWMVGDRDSDIACGQRAGTHTALIRYPLSRTHWGKAAPELDCTNLAHFVERLSVQP